MSNPIAQPLPSSQNYAAFSVGDLNGMNPGSGEFAYMSPDTLMSYCSARLKGIDAQVKEQFAKQEAANHATTALSALMQALGSSNGGAIVNAQTDPQGQQIQKAFQNALDATAGDGATNTAVRNEYAKFLETACLPKDDKYGVAPGAGGDKSATIDAKELQGMSDNIKQAQSDLNSGTEMSMIKLQQLMSQRQTAISTCTNLVSTLDQAQIAIAQNLKSG